MSEQTIRNLLVELSIKETPPNLDLWPEIQHRIRTELKNQNAYQQPRLRPMTAAVFVLLIITAGTAILFATPQGRAWADSVLQYFQRAESDAILLPEPKATLPILPTRTASPTLLPGLQEATPVLFPVTGTPTPTSTPEPTRVHEETVWSDITIEEAERMAGYPVAFLPDLPPGYRLDTVIYYKPENSVTQLYEFHPYQAGEMIEVKQWPSNPEYVVGESAQVEVIDIGGYEVEYVSGMWFTESGSMIDQWHNDVGWDSFVWRDKGFTYRIRVHNNESVSPAFLTRPAEINLVELLMGVRETFPEQLNRNNLTNIANAETVAGFDLLAPSIIPRGFIFSHAAFDISGGARRVILTYTLPDGTFETQSIKFMIFEIPKGDSDNKVACDEYPPEGCEEVMIHDMPGVVTLGSFVNDVFDPNRGNSLYWETDELQLVIHDWNENHLTKEELITIAESME